MAWILRKAKAKVNVYEPCKAAITDIYLNPSGELPTIEVGAGPTEHAAAPQSTPPVSFTSRAAPPTPEPPAPEPPTRLSSDTRGRTPSGREYFHFSRQTVADSFYSKLVL